MKRNLLLLLLVCRLSTLCCAQKDTLPCNVADRDTTELQNLPWFGNNDYLESFLDSIGYPASNTNNRSNTNEGSNEKLISKIFSDGALSAFTYSKLNFCKVN